MPRYRVKRHPVTQPSDPSYRIIPLTKNQNTLVDTEDYERVNQWNWVAHWATSTKTFYAQREGDSGNVFMHRFIMNPPEGQQIDHIDGNTLDNRKANLRLCTHAENTKNKKKRNGKQFIGIHFEKSSGKWRAEIMSNYKTTFLGRYNTAEAAAKARDEAAKELHGEFASLNFPNC